MQNMQNRYFAYLGYSKNNIPHILSGGTAPFSKEGDWLVLELRENQQNNQGIKAAEATTVIIKYLKY